MSMSFDVINCLQNYLECVYGNSAEKALKTDLKPIACFAIRPEPIFGKTLVTLDNFN